MSARLLARAQGGQRAALAGYEIWGDALAHVGLAVVPHHRKHGLGRLAAAAAAHHATCAGLVPQWRCRHDNLASARVRDRIGFISFGGQIAIDLGAPSPEVAEGAT